MTIALKTVNYLDKEKEFIPWKASLRELGYVDSMLERTALYGPFSVSYIYFDFYFSFIISLAQKKRSSPISYKIIPTQDIFILV